MSWWKNPVLQGPENDYGEYDYLIEPLPDNTRYLLTEHEAVKCEACGKHRHILYRHVNYFRTLDGYDSMSYDECIICSIKNHIHKIKNKLKKRSSKYILSKEQISIFLSLRQRGFKYKEIMDLLKIL